MSIIHSNNAGIKSLIEEWFEKNVTTKVKYHIVKNGKKLFSHIDVDGDVVIENYEEHSFPIYIKFGTIHGSFICANGKNSSMSSFPSRVDGDFSCASCKNISSLNGIPKYIGGNCDVRNCGAKFTELAVLKVSAVTGQIYC